MAPIWHPQDLFPVIWGPIVPPWPRLLRIQDRGVHQVESWWRNGRRDDLALRADHRHPSAHFRNWDTCNPYDQALSVYI